MCVCVCVSRGRHERDLRDQQLLAGGAAGAYAFGEAVMREASSFARPRVELLCAMFERLADSEALPELTRLLGPEEMKQLRGKLGPLWYFDDKNPGGHYGPLALADSRHRRVVELLLLREAKERSIRAAAGECVCARVCARVCACACVCVCVCVRDSLWACVGAVQLGRQLRVKINGAKAKHPLRCASLALDPLPLIFSYKPEKSLCGTGRCLGAG